MAIDPKGKIEIVEYLIEITTKAGIIKLASHLGIRFTPKDAKSPIEYNYFNQLTHGNPYA